MLDFKELPDDGIKFEQLVRELLVISGHDVQWTGVGPDGGKDLVLTEHLKGPFSDYDRKWLISCKHKANSGGSVNTSDLGDFSADCATVDAEGFLIVCSTHLSAPAIRRLEEVSKSKNILTKNWDCIELEKQLMQPGPFGLISIFFPISARQFQWKIYNAFSPSFWAGNYKDYFLYMSSRTASTFPYLNDIEEIVRVFEEIDFSKQKGYQQIRLRSVYYDDKHCTYLVCLDYLYEKELDKKTDLLSHQEVKTLLMSAFVDLEIEDVNYPEWDIHFIPVNTDSDHFHEDHKSYYEPYLTEFKSGVPRGYFG